MKNRLLFLFALLTVIYTDSYSQDQKTILRLHFIAPGLTLEQRLGENFSFSYEIGSGVQFYYSNVNGESSSDLSFFPYIRFEPRFYFDLEKRKLNGKRTDFLSSNYASLQIKKSFPLKNYESWYSYGFIVGTQRTFGKSGYFDFGIGLGGTTMGYDTSFGFIGNFHLGILLNSK